MRFSLSPSAQTELSQQGTEGEIVIRIEDALADPLAAVDHAAMLSYSRIGPYYPGVRATPHADFRRPAIAIVGALIDLCAGCAPREWSGDCFFSMVTTTPDRLLPIQRFPHYDGVEENRYAALLFLCSPEFGGTNFYRHIATGFETVSSERFPIFAAALEREVNRRGLPRPAYVGDGEPFFERIAEHDAKLNRMLIYRGKALHCSAIKAPELLCADPRRGRLTLNLFLTPGSSPR